MPCTIQNVTKGTLYQVLLRGLAKGISLSYPQFAKPLDSSKRIVSVEEKKLVTRHFVNEPYDLKLQVFGVNNGVDKEIDPNLAISIYYIHTSTELYNCDPYCILSTNQPPTFFKADHFKIKFSLSRGGTTKVGKLFLFTKKHEATVILNHLIVLNFLRKWKIQFQLKNVLSKRTKETLNIPNLMWYSIT